MQRERKKDWDSKDEEEISDIKMTKERNKNDLQLVPIKLFPLQSHCQPLSHVPCLQFRVGKRSKSCKVNLCRSTEKKLFTPALGGQLPSARGVSNSWDHKHTVTKCQPNLGQSSWSKVTKWGQPITTHSAQCCVKCWCWMIWQDFGNKTVTEHFISAQLHQD